MTNPLIAGIKKYNDSLRQQAGVSMKVGAPPAEVSRSMSDGIRKYNENHDDKGEFSSGGGGGGKDAARVAGRIDHHVAMAADHKTAGEFLREYEGSKSEIGSHADAEQAHNAATSWYKNALSSYNSGNARDGKVQESYARRAGSKADQATVNASREISLRDIPGTSKFSN